VDKKTQQIICTAFTHGKCHDFKLFKDSKTRIHPQQKVMTDSGYQGIKKLHAQTESPKKAAKNIPLTKEEKKQNRVLSSIRVVNEHAIGLLKRFKILADKYRSRRKRFGLRFNLIAGLCNMELS
jgi:hypothetical protein